MTEGKVLKVSGPVIVADGMSNTGLLDIVAVGEKLLTGEIIDKYGDLAAIQVYGETLGLGYGEKVISKEVPLMAELGPGLLAAVYDGIQRPMKKADKPALDREKLWHFTPMHVFGDLVGEGDLYGTVKEAGGIVHKIMVPPGKRGTVIELREGDFTVAERIGKIKLPDGTIEEITLMQKWPVRIPRPYKKRRLPTEPLALGQRTIDASFPLAKGGAACVLGAVGTGKTTLQQQIAKQSDADIVVYIGCGVRRKDIDAFARDLAELKDKKSGRPLLERTVIVASTPDMPVATGEASLYTGMTIAEYYRDMGYSVLVIADSISSFAEASCEIAERLEGMSEEGRIAHLVSRIGQFYERAGSVICLGREGRQGYVSVIGSIVATCKESSEYAEKATRRAVKALWELDASLAYYRHFPAINLQTSYSLYCHRFESTLEN
jgi:V/A-type H+-transporting ATPase subunit A